jgi:ferric-dicitrate binding protein FerR (iron transport regulator)
MTGEPRSGGMIGPMERLRHTRQIRQTWREWLPIAGLTALMVLETFFDLRRAPTPSPWLWNSYLIVYVVAALACLILWRRPHHAPHNATLHTRAASWPPPRPH